MGEAMKHTLGQKMAAEFAGTLLLLCAIVGSGIMAERLCAGNTGLALLVNVLAIAGALTAILLALIPVSGAHLNPVVTLVDRLLGRMSNRDAAGYVLAQFAGAVSGTMLANGMFGLRLVQRSTHARHGAGVLVGEFVATFGLLLIIWGCARSRPTAVPFAVGGYILGAIWFTSSTAFANPAVTVARTLTDTFTGIRPVDAPAFVAVELAAGLVAVPVLRWLFGGLAE
jgi:glycerol uptake facilitator-like aquaporin